MMIISTHNLIQRSLKTLDLQVTSYYHHTIKVITIKKAIEKLKEMINEEEMVFIDTSKID